MSDAFRQKVIRVLIDDIALLSGGRFEQFGYKMMEVIYPAQWAERGTTVEGAPRGYTVDSSAVGSTLIAEMSSESDYFHQDLDKPNRDLRHAIELHPYAKRIWLLASREAKAGETTKCANLETEFLRQNDSVLTVQILDARKIAEHIFNNLEVESFVNNLTSYLPSIGRLADENVFSHRIPAYPDYQPRPELEKVLVDRIEDGSWVVVSGISGIGKTALVASVAQKLSDFDLVIWYDANRLNNVAELYDVDVLRSGTRHNIASLLRRHKCLLILDDTLISYDQFSDMNCGESKILMTSQTTSAPNPVIVEDFDYESARVLLEAGVPTACPSKVFEHVYSTIGGYPLLLGALNRLAKLEGWESVNTCCEEATVSLEDDRHNKVCQRILLRHRKSLALELEFVKWCGTSRFASELAAVCVSTRAVSNLEKRSFLSAAASGEIRVHDVVYQSICSVIDVSAQHETTFRDKLDDFICKKCENERSGLRRIVNLHSQLLKRLLRSNPRPSFIYAVALARTRDTQLELLGDPVAAALTITKSGNWQGREIDVRAVIEAVEAIYTIQSTNQGAEAAKTSLQVNISALAILRDSLAAKDEILRDINHHYAKMLIRLGKLADAESEFRAILVQHPTFAAGRLQLSKILENTERGPDALNECRSIVVQYEKDQSSVATPILLEALRTVVNKGTQEDLMQYEKVIMSSIAEARELHSALALRLIASVAQKTWYTMPQLVCLMFDSIEWRDAVPTSDPERFDWAQAHKDAAKVFEVGDARRHEFLIAAVETYSSIIAANNYCIVHHAEALILLERFDEAIVLLDRVPTSERVEFWWQRKAQALLGSKNAEDALVAINNGLRLVPKKYKPAFLHLSYKIRKFLSDPEATEDLKMAISALPPDDKYRKELESELNE